MTARMAALACAAMLLLTAILACLPSPGDVRAAGGGSGLVFGVTSDLHFNTPGGSTVYVDDMADDYMNNSNLKSQWGQRMRFVIDNGDFCGQMNYDALGDWKATWLERLNVPVFANPGNHDVRVAGDDPYVTDDCMNESGNPMFPSYALVQDGILFIFVGDWDVSTAVHPIQRQWVEYLLDLYSDYTTVIIQHQSWGVCDHSSESYHHVHDGDWWYDIFSNNPQIKLCFNGHNHYRDYARVSSSPYINGGTSWGHDILFVQTPTFGSNWGANRHNSAIVNITDSAIQFRWWDASISAWGATAYSWSTSTTYSPGGPGWYSFPFLFQDGQSYRQPNQWIAENITLQLIGSKPMNFFENEGFHWCIDRASLAWASIGNDSALDGNWDNVDYASYLNTGTDAPLTLDYPNLNKDYSSSETTVQQSSVPRAIPGKTYHMAITLRTPGGSQTDAFTMTMKCGDKSTGDIYAVLPGSEATLLDGVSTSATWQTYHANYTVPDDSNAWFIKGELDFLKSVEYHVSKLVIERQATSGITENFNLTVSGTVYQGGTLNPGQMANFTVSPASLTDSDGYINMSASIGGNHVGWMRLIFEDPVFTRNHRVKLNGVSNGQANVTLCGTISRWSNTFKAYSVSDRTNFTISDGSKQTGSNGNEWLQADGGSVSTLTITYGKSPPPPSWTEYDSATYGASATVDSETPELGPPGSFTAAAVDMTTINLSWVNDPHADRTVIRQVNGSYTGTWDHTTGEQIYNGTGESFLHSVAEQSTHSYGAWHWNATLGFSDVATAENTSYGGSDLDPPTANFTWTADGINVSFTDTSTDSDGSIVNWTWDFGDGNVSYEQNPIRVYGADGSYNVTLTVTDNDSLMDDVTKTVVVSSGSGGIVDEGDYKLLLYVFGGLAVSCPVCALIYFKLRNGGKT
mgnify:CR=1 FL=1